MKQIGDVLTLKVPKDNSDWGYKPAPNGTKCTIVGFGDIAWGRTNNCGVEPGVYENRCWVNVKFTVKGAEQQACIGSFCFEERDIEGDFREKKRLSDLPETKFWEWDIVRPIGGKPIFKEWGVNLKIQSVQWHWERDQRGYCYMVESVDVPHSGSTYMCDSELELVKRGKVWDYYHKIPLHFKDIREESQFYSALGHTDEVRNPNNKLYSWNLDEALSAIKVGIGHGFYMDSFMGSKSHPSVVTYRNQAVGKRVAEFTLSGWKDYLSGETEVDGKHFELVNFK